MTSRSQRLLRNLDWNLLYTFTVIVDEGSITGAARKLSLSQPSISNALKRLETHLETPLIKRKKGLFSLTYQGLKVYEYATSAGRIIENMADQFAGGESVLSGEINIQIASHIHSPCLDKTLAEYHRLYPRVLININTQPSSEIIRAVARDELHIGLSNQKVAKTGLRFDLLGYEQMGFYCAKNHLLYGVKNLQLNDLSGLSYVSFESDQPSEGLNEISSLRSDQQLWGNLVAVSSNEEEIRRLIFAGLGFGALTVQGAKVYVANKTLFQLPPYQQLPVNEVFLVTAENQPMSDSEQIFVTMLLDFSRESVRKNNFSQA
ncbi:MAG: transcriptional regulator [Osedax symbiont Rs1]|nr:MAG: transcriptional regulator [Osedax symbiont Rs1]